MPLPAPSPWNPGDLVRDLFDGGYLVDGSPGAEVAREVLAGGEQTLDAPSRIIYERSLLHAMRALSNREPRLHILELLMRDG